MDFHWLNEPPHWQESESGSSVQTGDRTDFWNRTHYGFIHSSGHFRWCERVGDFTAQARVLGDYEELYDEAGLMLHVDDNNWLKCGVELTDGAQHFSTVVTRDGWSDWSQLRLPEAARGGITVRLTRHGNALRVQFRLNDTSWMMARLAYLNMPEKIKIGMMCCSPQRSGLQVAFSDFIVSDPISPDLHA